MISGGGEISWTRWGMGPAEQEFFAFVCRASRLMREHPVLRRRRFFHGRPIRGAGVKDIMWLAPNGLEMSEAEWSAAQVGCLGVRLAGDSIGEVDEVGRPIQGETLIYLLNARSEPVPFTLPVFTPQPVWRCLFDTSSVAKENQTFHRGEQCALADRSVAVFVRKPRPAV